MELKYGDTYIEVDSIIKLKRKNLAEIYKTNIFNKKYLL